MDYRVISIGALSRHELWGEQTETRTAHATTTLIRSAGRTILVDPGLPPQAIAARLNERSGLDPSAVTDVFLTNFRPAHRRGLSAFDHARWYISEAEREGVGRNLVELFRQADSDEQRSLLQQEIAILQRFQVAPDRLTDHVDLFPSPGYSPGTCGLLLSLSNATVVVAGDAVATIEHLEQGKVLRGSYDLKQAQESFMEAIEIADVIVPGHDNLLINPTRRSI
jgi:glyoxylase-like metal-dependent hydrolase (beta-lactamase superfamily II)